MSGAAALLQQPNDKIKFLGANNESFDYAALK